MKKLVYDFSSYKTDGDYSMKSILGNKGASLADMCSIGINVPPGCTIVTDVSIYYINNNNKIPDELYKQVKDSIANIEKITSKKLGNIDNPLLLSIRSGSSISMPGMMDTILNLGLNDEITESLAIKTGNHRFAYDCYRRFIQMYSSVVLSVDHYHFEEIIDRKKQEKNINLDTELSVDDLKSVIKSFKEIIYNITKEEWITDIEIQLWKSIESVFLSWNNNRAITYRKINNISSNLGTAVNIQSMVFGNMGDDSATGVVFTRNPVNGCKEIFGEYLINAQGEDVVAGIRTPQFITNKLKQDNKSDLSSMEEKMPELFNELSYICNRLENHYKDMQDIEFTIENNILYILQTRSAKRTIQSAIKIAVNMEYENLISKDEAIMRINTDSLNQILHPTLDHNHNNKILTKALPASPGAASGVVVFNTEDAESRIIERKKVILVRIETSPEDIGGMHIAEGILTNRGGMTSHAAVVARGMGKACVCGASDIMIDYKNKMMKINDEIIKEGDEITINGSTGEIILGIVPTINPVISNEFKTILSWADNIKKLSVRANAETISDALIAKEWGAEGIGLCRTEHMFFKEDRINYVRAMIIADNKSDRKAALDKILPMQKNDFIELFNIMNGKSVNIRLLDPPLHEFLPHSKKDIENLASILDIPYNQIKSRILSLKEHNPMIGHRGCRIGISYPEIYEMQVESIFLAMIDVMKKNVNPIVEIMIPFIFDYRELKILRELVENIANKLQNKNKLNYSIGTMIETPRAALTSGDIANFADFFSFGTNDLTQTSFAISRDDSNNFLNNYQNKEIISSDPFVEIDEIGVGEIMKISIERGRKSNNNIKFGVCGEHGGNQKSIEFFNSIGLDYISCSPYRVPIAKLSAAQSVIKANNISNNIDHEA